MSCRFKFWGVRGSVPTPGPSTLFFGGNTPCVEVRADGEIIVLDAGTGIRPLGLALAKEFAGAPAALTLLISHPHWDHIHGFPFFQPAYDAKNKICVRGCADFQAGLEKALAGQMEAPYFPIAFAEMSANIVIEELTGAEFSIGPVKVGTHRANHPGVTMGFRLETSSGSIAYLPDNELYGQRRTAHIADAEGVDERLIEFARGADALIIDAHYDEDEYEAHVGWGHGCLTAVVELAIEAEVKRLFLFHHDPEHDDPFIHAMVGRARELAVSKESTLQIEAAREGDEVTL